MHPFYKAIKFKQQQQQHAIKLECCLELETTAVDEWHYIVAGENQFIFYYTAHITIAYSVFMP